MNSSIVRYDGRTWPDAPARAYKSDDGTHQGVTRHLIARPDAAAFEVRYFEVAPGGWTTFERHAHVHVVLCQRGEATVRLGDAVHDVHPGDVVIVASGEPHQFRCVGAAPFGFLCIVDRDRDRHEPLPES
jgi:quercetin dioxygenase-like cupin family protein